MGSSISDYYIVLETNKDLENPQFVVELFSRWALEAEETLPQFWGSSERLTREIGDLSELIMNWKRPVPLFGRRSLPSSLHQIDWPIGLSHRDRMFPGSLVSFLSVKTKIADLDKFTDLLFETFSPEYFIITKWTDARKRHFLPVMTATQNGHVSSGTQFQGKHVKNYLPGIYWKNYFGKNLATHFGIDKIATDKEFMPGLFNIERFRGGYKIDSSSSLKDFSEEIWRPCEKEIERLLGRAIFFTTFYKNAWL